MHSVVVLGDVRTHSFDVEADQVWEDRKAAEVRIPPKSYHFASFGGAVLMKNAIEIALRDNERLRTKANEKTNIGLFGFKNSGTPNKGPFKTTGHYLRWFLKPFMIEESDKPRPRLCFRSEHPGQIPPVADENLIQCLTDTKPSNRRFESTTIKGLPDTRECPDIVVFDDLNEGFRQIRFEIPTDENIGKIEKELKDSYYKPDSFEADIKNIEALYALLFYRFSKAQDLSKQDKVPILEPIIIGSIKKNPSNLFKKGREILDSNKRSVWEHIYANEWLRERTCIILDAMDLRDDGCAISSGLSWERTAQNTIHEFLKNDHLRPYLEFDQVIVRYGVTGALHIVRRGNNEWSFRLVFDPAHDDLAWAVDEKDGVVLGVTSIYAATIVQALDRHCQELNEHPFIGRYAMTIGECLPEAIARSRYLNDYGYGNAGWKDFVKRFDGDPQCPDWFPEDLFVQEKLLRKPEVKLKPNRVSWSSVPPMILENWSIVGQSAQGRYGKVAREIVKYGPDKVLNQPPLSQKTIFEAVAKLIVSKLRNVAENLETPPVSLKELITNIDWHEISLFTYEEIQKKTVVFGSRSSNQITSIIKGPDVDKLNWKAVKIAILKWDQEKTDGKLTDSFFQQLTELLQTGDTTILTNVISLPETSYIPEEALVAPLVAFPAVKGDKPIPDKWPLFIVDRREIEGYRAIRRLMKNHIDNVQKGKSNRPLCIAVFGPPGSGKSIAVKKINDSLPNTNTEVLDPFNVAQFEGLKDLEGAFDKILKASQGTTVPIAFFDEFDTNFGDNPEPLGWLKYFLAPMEDGEFRGKAVRNAILVFAGGTSRTFSEFSLANRSRTDAQWINFSKAKGPDFTSRLLGHLDIVGINPVGGEDELYMIRRAILIRSLLTQIQELHTGDSAKIKDEMLNAFLHVPEYLHGGRSVRMLLQLCGAHDDWITSSSVPPLHQLNMLVDGKAFMDLLSSDQFK